MPVNPADPTDLGLRLPHDPVPADPRRCDDCGEPWPCLVNRLARLDPTRGEWR